MRILKKEFFKEVFELLKSTAVNFGLDKGMKLSASLAYYSVFSIAPLLLIIIWVIGFLFGEYIEGHAGARSEVFSEFSALFGPEVSFQIQQVIQKISIANKSGIGIAVGVVTLVIGSTTIFVEIQDSINTIWKVRAKPKKGWLKMLINRVISFSMVIGFGFLLIASLILNGIIGALSSYINELIPIFSAEMMNWINFGLTYLIICILFAVIFNVLPDAKIRFKDTIAGSLFTGSLFMVGRYLIALYMTYMAPASAYGAAGSLIVLLLWIYYSAVILYFGAEFTRSYAEKYGNGIQPASYAVKLVQQEIEKEGEKIEKMVVNE